MIILVIANTYVYTVAVCHLRKISMQTNFKKSSTNDSLYTSGIWRSLLVSFLLTASFIVGFAMNLVIRILRITEQITLEKELWLNQINYPIMTLKCTVSPIICVALNKSLRSAVYTTICRMKCDKRNDIKLQNSSIQKVIEEGNNN